MRDGGLERAIDAAGGVAQLARRIGIAQPSVSNWNRVPDARVLAVEAATGVSRKLLRPDLYGEFSPEGGAVDRPLDQEGRVDPVVTQGGEEGHGAAVAEGRLAAQPLALRAPAPERRHVDPRPGLVDEDPPAGVDRALARLPARPVARHVRPALLHGRV